MMDTVVNGNQRWGRAPGRRRVKWVVILTVVVLLAAGGSVIVTRMGLLGGNAASATGQAAAGADGASLPTVAIQAAGVTQTDTSASGTLALVDERSVALAVSGVVEEIYVDVGDTAKAGDLLLRLETSDLERALAQAQLTVESSNIALADLKEPSSTADIAEAQAALVEAQENLADVQAGPSAAEIAAAQSSLAAAQSAYSELQAGPSAAELTQLSASLEKAEITLADAQRAYDQIAWQGSAGMSSQASDLQAATIDYESARAAYEEATAAAADSEIQSKAGAIQEAQVQLNELLNSPSEAEIATAQSQVVQAEAALAELQTGATANDLRSAEISLEQNLIELEAAYRDLAVAEMTAPMDGVVMSLNAEVGVRSSADTVVVTLSDPTQLELGISVAESDITRVSVGQPAQIEIDAFPGQTFNGVVQSISPVSDSSSGTVSYPVTVRLTDENLTGVLPGMNAVATLISQEEVAEGTWLVPSNALRSDGDVTTVVVVRDGQQATVVVATSGVQGEWTMVQSPELQAGDQVVGSVTSQLDSDMFGPFMTGGGPPGGAMGGEMPGGRRP
jgi:RND family efflux transporter MFP subunit